jgi:hypothetical protein
MEIIIYFSVLSINKGDNYIFFRLKIHLSPLHIIVKDGYHGITYLTFDPYGG